MKLLITGLILLTVSASAAAISSTIDHQYQKETRKGSEKTEIEHQKKQLKKSPVSTPKQGFKIPENESPRPISR